MSTFALEKIWQVKEIVIKEKMIALISKCFKNKSLKNVYVVRVKMIKFKCRNF